MMMAEMELQPVTAARATATAETTILATTATVQPQLPDYITFQGWSENIKGRPLQEFVVLASDNLLHPAAAVLLPPAVDASADAAGSYSLRLPPAIKVLQPAKTITSSLLLASDKLSDRFDDSFGGDRQVVGPQTAAPLARADSQQCSQQCGSQQQNGQQLKFLRRPCPPGRRGMPCAECGVLIREGASAEEEDHLDTFGWEASKMMSWSRTLCAGSQRESPLSGGILSGSISSGSLLSGSIMSQSMFSKDLVSGAGGGNWSDFSSAAPGPQSAGGLI